MNSDEYSAGHLPRLDSEQLRAVNARGDTIVSAGAGSGKTTVLTERYLSLLAGGAEVSGILTLTFTRKAAAEMHQRIYRALTERSDENPRWRSALEQFDEARISTLDSFVGEIARAGSAEFGIPPTFSTDEGELLRLSREAASDFLFSQPSDSSLARLVSDRGAEAILGDGLARLAQQEMSPVTPVDFATTIERQIERAGDSLRSDLGAVDQLLNTWNDAFAGDEKSKTARTILDGLDLAYSRFGSLVDLVSAKTLEAQRAAHGDTFSAHASGIEVDAGEVEQCIGWITAVRKPSNATNSALLTVKDTIDEAKELVGRIREALVFIASREQLRSLYRSFAEFQDVVVRRKRAAGLLSFTDVMELAIAVLERNSAIRTWYRRRIRHIMIDEFQDNNDRQKYLLELIAGRTPEADGEGEDRSRVVVGHGDGALPPGERSESGERSDGALPPGELFFVGDEKQSIYRFRGADVGVFKRLSRALGSGGGQTINLKTNYRSSPGLIARFNEIFAGVLRGGEDYEASFEALLDRDSPGQSQAKRDAGPTSAPVSEHLEGACISGSPDHPQLRLFLRDRNAPRSGSAAGGSVQAGSTDPDTTDSGSSDSDPQTNPQTGEAAGEEAGGELLDDTSTEAFFVAESIFRTVEAGSLLVGSGASDARPAAYDDIAILMRTGTNQYEYERMFRQFGIPYQSDAIRSLYLEAPVNDIYALLQLCLYPADRAAFATLLRSPLAALCDESIAWIFLADVPSFAPLPPPVARNVNDDDIARYEAARAMYERIREDADRVSIRSLLHTIWYDFGYRTLYLANPANHSYLEYYDVLSAMARNYEQEGLAAFLDALRANLGEFHRTDEFDVLGREASGVRIMSVHRSKGLEFPVVFVVGCGSSGLGGVEARSVWHRHREFGVTVNVRPPEGMASGTGRARVNPFLTEARNREAAEESAELRRLLYVAMTRAENHCFLSGAWAPRSAKARAVNPLPRCFFDLIEEHMDSGLPVERIADRSVEQRRHARVTQTPRSAEEIDRFYEEGEYVQFDRSPLPRSPSALNAAHMELTGADGSIVESDPLPDFACEAIIEREEKNAEFGTLAHWCAAILAQDEHADLARRVPRRVLGLLPEEHRGALLGEAERCARTALAAISERFGGAAGGGSERDERGTGERSRAAASGADADPADSRAAASGTISVFEEVYPELAFEMILRAAGRQARVHGAIDLVVRRSDGALIVADFKSDRVFRAEHYRIQMDLYRRAAVALFGVEPQVLLVSLRDGALHDVPAVSDSEYAPLL